MVNSDKKAIEKRQLEMVLTGLIDYASLEPSEGPDWWVRCNNAPEFAVEITEYHPAEPEYGQFTRLQTVALWREKLWPTIDKTRRMNPLLQHLSAFLYFKNRRLPRKKDHAKIAEDLVKMVASLSPKLVSAGEKLGVSFLPREALIGHSERWLAKEDWPLLAEHLSKILIHRYTPIWPPWKCPGFITAFPVAFQGKFRQILEKKALKAQGYKLGHSPLWLVIACDVAHDVSSHVFPLDENGLEELAKVIRDCGFDFRASLFKEVWLLSHFSGAKLRLHPPSHGKEE